jgi:hypothetical protein
MALLDGKNLAAEAARRARFRVHHVGTKLNEAELHELEALAAKRKETQAELIRGLILHELARDAEGHRPSAEMTEITACRLLLTYLLRPVATGQPMTEQGVRRDGRRGQEAQGACGSGPAQRPRSAALSIGGRVPSAAVAVKGLRFAPMNAPRTRALDRRPRCGCFSAMRRMSSSHVPHDQGHGSRPSAAR